MEDSKMVKFPSIEQFRNAVKNYRYLIENRDAPTTIEYRGSVKLHGSNSAVVRHPDGSITTQSRNNIITPDSDNFGFSQFVSDIGMATFKKYFDLVEQEAYEITGYLDRATIAVFGEWAGPGIQKDVAISLLESKMFFIFGIRATYENGSTVWVSEYPGTTTEIFGQDRVHYIGDFPELFITLDFDNLAEAQNQLIEMTLAVERECPVGKAFKQLGTGEGIVWKPEHYPYKNVSDLWFKVKGEKHSSSKVKKLASVDVEKANSVKDFANSVLTESRLSQGIEFLKEQKKDIEMSSMGDYLRWVANDVIKEESDTMEASGLVQKDVMRQLSSTARNWYTNHINQSI